MKADGVSDMLIEAMRQAGVPESIIKTNDVLEEVLYERSRQDEKWGEQNHPNGTGSNSAKALADVSRQAADTKAKLGTVTWLDILNEEVWEAFAEEDTDLLREELIQVAAVAVAWVEAIDRKKSNNV